MTEKLPWLALRGIPGIGLVLFQRLARACGSPAAVFQAPAAELRAIRGLTPALVQAITSFKDWRRLEDQLEALKARGAEMLTQDDPRFPPGLRQIPYPPPFLFVQGVLEPQEAPGVALVGTRTPSYYGLRTCRRLAQALSARGCTVVSGLARGIDTAAHQGTIEAGGRTLAVLGCGLDVVYPPENRGLYEKIPTQGAIISEFPLGAPPEARNFPIRNRLISGLSLGVVVVEAAAKSGTHITVQYALDQGREVFAVPGPVDSATSLGPHRLIQQGAKLVHDAEDIFSELPALKKGQRTLFAAPAQAREAAAPAATPSPPPEDPLLPFLGSDPIGLEELTRASRLPASEVLSRLTLLELQGLVKELPGKCYVLEA